MLVVFILMPLRPVPCNVTVKALLTSNVAFVAFYCCLDAIDCCFYCHHMLIATSSPAVHSHAFVLLSAGRQQLHGTTSAGSATSFPSFPSPAGQDFPAAHSSGAIPQFSARIMESAIGSTGWSRPFSPQALYPAGPSIESQSPSAAFRHGSDQVSKSQQHAEQILSLLAAHTIQANIVMIKCKDI